jgi:hypothetical protein
MQNHEKCCVKKIKLLAKSLNSYVLNMNEREDNTGTAHLMMRVFICGINSAFRVHE